MSGKVNKNAKKLIKREVKKVEKKQHPHATKAAKRSRVVRVTNRTTNGTGKRVLRELGELAAGATAERRAAVELAKRLCVPNMFSSFAVQDGFTSVPVGVASPYMVTPVQSSSVAGSVLDGLGVSSSETWAAAFRDPHRCLLFYDATARTYKYTFIDDSGASTFTLAASAAMNFDAANFASGLDIHGSKLYSGVVKEGPGAGSRWFIGNKLQYIEITGLAASTAVTLQTQVLVNDEVKIWNCTVTSSAGGVATFPWSSFVKQNGSDPDLVPIFHWQPRSSTLAITSGSISFGATAALPGLRQYSLAGFQTLNQTIEKLRFSALNLMYSNTSQEFYKGGLIAGRQVPSNLDFFTLVSQGWDQFSTKPEALRIGARNGAHMFYKTAELLDWEFLDIGEPSGGGSCGGNYVIDADEDYMVMATSMPEVSERGGYWSVFTNVEYRHNSVWLPLVRPGHTRRVFEDALAIMAEVPVLHENPLHIKDIFNWIGKHKGQIQETIMQGAMALGGARATGYANSANKFIDIWFK